MLPVEVSFYYLQHFLSSSCHNKVDEITPNVLRRIVQNDTYIKNMLESMIQLLHATCYGTNERVTDHLESFWMSYPLITKLMIEQDPQCLFQFDQIGNLPLHTMAKTVCQIPMNLQTCVDAEDCSGIFFWLNEKEQHCPKINCRRKRERVDAQVPLIGYKGKTFITA